MMNIVHPFQTHDEPVTTQHLLSHAIEWAMEAGRVQRRAFRSQGLRAETKSSQYDLVTEIDRECERLIMAHIAETYPTHAILGEETGQHGAGADWQWVVDPLDGTNNYAQGLPIFCVSIGVQYRGVTQAGVVYAPMLDDLFTATLGVGASWNGKTIHVSRKTDLGQCVLATGFPYDKATVGPDLNNLNNVVNMVPRLRGLRRMGSAAYDLCCVAAGLLDGYWEIDIKPWDACAGALIVEQAGGKVIPFRTDRHVSIVAAAPAIADQILSIVR